MSNVAYLTATRGVTRTRLTKLCQKVNKDIDRMTQEELFSCLDKASKIEGELASCDSKISEALFASKGNCDEFTNELFKCEEYQDSLFQLKSKIKTRSPGLNQGNNPNSNAPSHSNKLKLPEVPLPKFSNSKTETLISFIEQFESVINSYNLSGYEKFVFLKRQLSGEPLLLINSLAVANQSYEQAVDLLKQAFASDVSQKYDSIRRLQNLKNITKPYEFVSEMRLIKGLFDTLEIDVEMIMQFFFWTSLSSGLQTQLIAICNSNKPSLEQILENIFKAIDRNNELSNKPKSRSPDEHDKFSNINSFAANVASSSKSNSSYKSFCSCCSEKDKRVTSHSTRNCDKYPNPRNKIDRLNDLNACTKCGFVNHSTAQCTFKFSKTCFDCGENHMTFLCINPKNSNNQPSTSRSPKTNDKSKIKSVASNIVWNEAAFQSVVGSESILPTFSCFTSGVKFRSLKDSGSQSNFIDECLATRLRLPTVLNDLEITVNGFNGSRKYLTRQVSIDIGIGDATHNINAVCVPQIRTKLELPDLGKIVDAFLTRGYNLADKDLVADSVTIQNVQFVLGTNDGHVLKETQIEFGSPVPSLYSMTPAGVLLMGNTERIISNIEALGVTESHNQQVTQLSSQSIALTEKSNKIDEIEANFVVVHDGEIDETMLKNASEEILTSSCNDVLQYEPKVHDEESTELDKKLTEMVLSNTTRAEDGRLIMPLTWKQNASHLGRNSRLAMRVLKANENKLMKNEEKLKMIDEVIRYQKDNGIIELIENKEQFEKEVPNHSYLAHMAVFRMQKESSKVRLVYLSNLCEKINNGISLSHNQTIHAGQCLNQKITTTVLQLRFDECLLCFDLQKAFLQIELSDVDANRLLFYWYKNVAKKDFSIVTYRSGRLPFGLRCSPTLLMLALYKILCIDAGNDDEKLKELKKMIYALIYVDNGACTGTPEMIRYAFNNLCKIFAPYKFAVQQITTNCTDIQAEVDESNDEITPKEVNLLGLKWNRETDTISTKKMDLDINASTKRQILSSIAQQYDPNGYQGPLLVRGRIFMHRLQCNASLGWDETLSKEDLQEWKLIAKQMNAAPTVQFPRYVGNRADPYSIVAYTDASKSVYACVIYLRNNGTGELNFITAKNRMVNKQLELKTIPSLELAAVSLGVDIVHEVVNELCGNKCVIPINIVDAQLFTDSSIALHWLNAYSHKHEKLQKQSIFVVNKLNHIIKTCEKYPIAFRFIKTIDNPADVMTRPCSYKKLMKSTFITGPTVTDMNDPNNIDDLHVVIPDPNIRNDSPVHIQLAALSTPIEPLVDVSRFSSFNRLVGVMTIVLKFIFKLKSKVKSKNPLKFPEIKEDEDLRTTARKHILLQEQKSHFTDIFVYLQSDRKTIKDIPPLLSRLNIFLDENGLLRIKSKFERWKDDPNFAFPVLLPNNSPLTKLIIQYTHVLLAHAGCYNVLTHLRKKFYVLKPYSMVKSVLNSCVTCKRSNSRSVKLTQNSYREFRVNLWFGRPQACQPRRCFACHAQDRICRTSGGRGADHPLCLW